MALTSRSSVCAVVPHYECEDWLEHALESLLGQTRPPDAIVVVDDRSARPPTHIVRRYPDVTLLAADDNGGPYRLVQAVIDGTRHDAYLFQDADDWSSPDRLEVLLDVAAETGAELVGCHEVRVMVDEGDVVPVRYPLDVNAALDTDARAYPLLHPTSLIGRELVLLVGGFATGMRFSGDVELLRRVAHVGRVVNADHFGYFRRKRTGSLTTARDTGLGSPRRRAVHGMLADRAIENAEAVRRGEVPDLRPWRTAPAPRLHHLAGPDLDAVCTRRGARVTASSVPRRGQEAADAPPVFLVGSPRAGHAELGWALAQHPDVSLLPDSRWIARAATDAEVLAGAADADAPDAFRHEVAATLQQLAWPAARRPVASGTELVARAHALRQLWPEARFVHLVRHPDEVAAALAASPSLERTFFTPDISYERWLDDVASGLALERSAPSRVMRIDYGRLAAEPDAAVTDVLRFLGLDEAPECLRTLRALVTRRWARPPTATAALVDRAHTVWRGLGNVCVEQPQVDDLARAFHRRLGAMAGSLADKVRRLCDAAPVGATVAVVSKGDAALVELGARIGRHFPSTTAGVYAGHHPADGEAALAHLTAMHAAGTTHFLVPAASFWWLDFYGELRRHLEQQCRLIAFEEGAGALWALSSPHDNASAFASSVFAPSVTGAPR